MPAEKALKRACLATAAFAVIEFFGGKITHSLALIADSAHLLTDAGALGLAFFAAWMSGHPATRKMSYGYHRVEILAALVNGAGLLTIAIFLVKEAVTRLHSPVIIHTPLMLLMGVAGFCFNLFIAFYLRHYTHHNMNVRSAFWHVLADLMGSVGVVVAGLVIWKTGWAYADSLISIVIASLIIAGGWRILKDVVQVLLEAAPARLDIARLESRLLSMEGVQEICDLHVWTITSGKEALSAHLGVQAGVNAASLLKEVNILLAEEFDITHTTIQIEECRFKPHGPHGSH